MRKTTALAILSIGLLISACSKPTIEGNAFVVKGDGDVKPAAGQTVHLIPLESEVALFYPAAMAAYASATEGLEPQLKPLCESATEFVGRTKQVLEDNLNEIEQRGTVPKIGCTSLEAELNRLVNQTKELNEAHARNISNLQAKIRDIRSRKARKVSRRATKLRNEEISAIKVTHAKSDRYFEDYQISIGNPTEYCIGKGDFINGYIGFEIFSKGMMIQSLKSVQFDIYKDKYGFNTKCLIPPKSHVSGHYSLYMDSAEVKLLVSQHGLPVKDGKIIPDRAVLRNPVFYTSSSKQVGARVEYMLKPVDWLKQAVKNVKFSEDAEIQPLEQQVSQLEKTHNSNSLTKSYAQAKSSAESCLADQAAIEKIANDISGIETAGSGFASCLGEKPDTSEIMGALTSLNKKFDQDFEIPNIDSEYIAEAMIQILMAIKGDSSKTTETTIEGAYKFKEVNKDNYLLYSEYADTFVKGFWLKPIVVKEDGRFDLNNNSLVTVPFGEYLFLQLTEACKSCSREEFENSLLSNSEILERQKQ